MKNRCMVPNCHNNSVRRGLCAACSIFARRMIEKGETTWEELETAGKCLPSNRKSAAKRREWFSGKL